jgi:peptidoglycan hydrolase-like protein with peptidoglycan-binding domain
MQTHDNDHDQDQEHENEGGEHGAAQSGEQAPGPAHQEADFGGEPAPRVAAAMAAPAPAHAPEAKAQAATGRALGNFLLTHYTFALESDPIHAKSPKVQAPGLPAGKKYKQSFLGSPYGIKMQGTGLADDGQYIHYKGSNSYGYGVGGAGGAPAAWKTVAVDPHVIKMHSHLNIETYHSKGTFEAKDTGGAIKGKHIDVFAGAIPIKQAYALGTKHSDVFLVEGSGGGAKKDDHADDHKADPKTEHKGGGDHGGVHHIAGFTHAPSLADARSGKHMLRRGQEGESIKWLQEKLHSVVGGHFGPITTAAVKKFQAAHHLEVDAIVGPHTMAALDGKPDPKGGNDHKTGGGGSGPPPPAGSEAAVRDQVIAKAKTHTNAPYSWAAQGPSMFDCSGFSWYVLHTDMHLTTKGRTNAEGLSHAPYTTPTSHPEKGDLVFYGGGTKSHVTIALGSGSQTIGASGGGSSTHGNNPKAKVKQTDWSKDSRAKSFGSIDKLIQAKLSGKK